MAFTDYFNRDDRPLPKRGCSVAFYAVLLLIVAFLAVMFAKYKNIQ